MTEAALTASALSYTIVGPTYFYDNIIGDLPQIRAGSLELALPIDTPLQQLSRRDLGRFVAEISADPLADNRRLVDLASDAPTPRRMAAHLTPLLGREVHADSLDPHDIGSPDMRAIWATAALGKTGL